MRSPPLRSTTEDRSIASHRRSRHLEKNFHHRPHSPAPVLRHVARELTQVHPENCHCLSCYLRQDQERRVHRESNHHELCQQHLVQSLNRLRFASNSHLPRDRGPPRSCRLSYLSLWQKALRHFIHRDPFHPYTIFLPPPTRPASTHSHSFILSA